MENLPRDIALDILSRLPFTTLAQINRVCRSWRAIANDPRLPHLYDTRKSERDPVLILQSNSPIQNRFYVVCNDGGGGEICATEATRFGDQLRMVANSQYLVEGSCNGLLCVCDSRNFDPKYIINPFTGDFVKLPKATQYKYQEISYGFGFHLTTMEYKVVRIASHIQDITPQRSVGWSDVQIISLGSDDWTSIGRCPWCLDYGSSEVFLNGSFHWSSRRYHSIRGSRACVVSFDLDVEEFNEIKHPDFGRYSDFHILVLREHLSVAVQCENGSIEIWVMKEYNVKETWSKDIIIPAYFRMIIPNQYLILSSNMWDKSRVSRGPIQVLCMLKSGEIVLEYCNKALFQYDPEKGGFKEFSTGLPKRFSTTAHDVSLSKFQIARQDDDAKKWPDNVEEAFIMLMVEEVENKRVQTCTFPEKTWDMFDDGLLNRFGHRYTVPKLKDKCNRLRQKYRAFAELLKHTKFRWDMQTNEIFANGQDTWNKYLKMHPNGRCFIKKGYKHYNMLKIIFSNCTAVGALSRTASQPIPRRGDVVLDCWCCI